MAFQRIASKQDIEEDKVYSFTTKFCDLAIVKRGNNFFAFEDVCTHDGGTISEGELRGDVIICPRHFAEFDIRNGKVLCMPATEDLPVYPIRINGDEIEVDLE
ncbi:Rieske (2Fe-2S) protein [Leptospira sp. GIMC2001]|uniref:Rieske (2Fe-2S) protein n=1 Tax=Leptospira sp. GIMC2001 TaxID=1513297 RepID=UPI00234BC810|nr:non-heme iron oxygenase ferredoxin subunit [Leptospira sp. GIMC2001]WCL51132.1 non-heme iron oxygenase ferredoxin subunit [Leptospira sp. GIMC2001]